MYGEGTYDYDATQLSAHLGNGAIKNALMALEATGACAFFAWREDRKLVACVRYNDEQCFMHAGAVMAYIAMNGEERLPSRKQERAKADLEFIVFKEIKASAYSEESQSHVALANEALKKVISALESVHAKWRYEE